MGSSSLWERKQAISGAQTLQCLVQTPLTAIAHTNALCSVSFVQESIAFYGGQHRESAIAGGRLGSLVATTRRKLAWEAGLSLWDQRLHVRLPHQPTGLARSAVNAVGVLRSQLAAAGWHAWVPILQATPDLLLPGSDASSASGASLCVLQCRYATILVPSLLTAPRYFAGQIEFGVIAQARLSHSVPRRPCSTWIRCALWTVGCVASAIANPVGLYANRHGCLSVRTARRCHVSHWPRSGVQCNHVSRFPGYSAAGLQNHNSTFPLGVTLF